jgi:hypothetical protein
LSEQIGSDQTVARVDGECQPDQPLTAAINATTRRTVTPDQIRAALLKAADLIEPEGRWTQGASARDERGWKVSHHWYADEAVCFCATGAIERACLGPGRLVDRAIDVLGMSLRVSNIPQWNDAEGRTQVEVVAALRKAAEEVEAHS